MIYLMQKLFPTHRLYAFKDHFFNSIRNFTWKFYKSPSLLKLFFFKTWLDSIQKSSNVTEIHVRFLYWFCECTVCLFSIDILKCLFIFHLCRQGLEHISAAASGVTCHGVVWAYWACSVPRDLKNCCHDSICAVMITQVTGYPGSCQY